MCPSALIVGAVSGTASGRWLSPEMLLDDPGLKKTLESNEPGKTLLKEIKAHPKTLAKWEEAAKQAAADGKPVPEKPALPSNVGDFVRPVHRAGRSLRDPRRCLGSGRRRHAHQRRQSSVPGNARFDPRLAQSLGAGRFFPSSACRNRVAGDALGMPRATH